MEWFLAPLLRSSEHTRLDIDSPNGFIQMVLQNRIDINKAVVPLYDPCSSLASCVQPTGIVALLSHWHGIFIHEVRRLSNGTLDHPSNVVAGQDHHLWWIEICAIKLSTAR